MSSFLVICFADLKKYKFTYHFCFPALHTKQSWKLIADRSTTENSDAQGHDLESSRASLTSEETIALVDQVQTWRYSVDARQFGFFLAKKNRSLRGKKERQSKTEAKDTLEEQNEPRPLTPATPVHNLGFTWVVGSLASYEQGFFDSVGYEDRYVCFADPSTYPTGPGWMLRNLLTLVQHRWKLDRIQILCYREVHARRHEAKSVILNILLDRTSDLDRQQSESNLDLNSGIVEAPKITGWERNAGKLASKIANLGEYMDPQR